MYTFHFSWQLIHTVSSILKSSTPLLFPVSHLIIGKPNAGKSSLLNSIIGYNLDLLDFGNNHCTKKAFIIKYCESKEDISLTSADIQKNAIKMCFF